MKFLNDIKCLIKKNFCLLLPTNSPRILIKTMLIDYNHSTFINIGEHLELQKNNRISSISIRILKGDNEKIKNYIIIKNNLFDIWIYINIS